jgi:hypothetical protein
VWHDSSEKDKDAYNDQFVKIKNWLTRIHPKTNPSDAVDSPAAGSATPDTSRRISTKVAQVPQQTNGVDCGVWMCMFAAYLLVGNGTCDIQEREENGSKNMNFVRRWMIHCIDERGQEPDGGQSSEEQRPLDPGRVHDDHTSVPSSRESSQAPAETPPSNPAGLPPDQLPPIPEDPVQPGDETAELETLKKTASDFAQKANTTLTAYEAKLDAAKKKHREVEQMTKSITDTIDASDKTLKDIEASFESAERDKNRATVLLRSIDTSLTTLDSIFKEADDAVTKTLSMPNLDNSITWAINGSQNAKTNFEGVKTETTNLQGSVTEKLDLAGTAIAQRTDALAKCNEMLQHLITIRTTIEEQCSSCKSQTDLYNLQVTILKRANTEIDKICGDVAGVSTIEDANFLYSQ